MQSWGPHTQSFEAVNMNFGYFAQHTSSMRKHYGYFFKPPSEQASGSRRCWKMQSWGPGIQSFEVVNMNFGYFGQHTRCMKKPYWLFLLPPSGQASCSRRCWKRHSKGTGIQRFEAVIMNIRYTGQHNSSIKTLWVLFDTTFRARFRLRKVLENAVLRPSPPAPGQSRGTRLVVHNRTSLSQ